MSVLECADQTSTLPVLLFLFGLTMTFAFLVVVRNVPVRDALPCVVGARKFEKGLAEWCFIGATLAVPLLLWTSLIQDCAQVESLAFLF